ncbi:MAG: hypothetical protein KF788_22825, partial [Piscinibacter sp.]|nr:hypothetical protein [Piscinibacter sp.]
VAALRPPAPAVAPALAAALFAPGDRLLFKDSDPISGVGTEAFARTVTRLAGDELEFDDGLLRIGPGARGSVKGNAHAEVVTSGPRVDGVWPAQFLPAAAQAEPVPLKLRFERDEVRRVGGRELRLVRAAVSGFASRRDGIPGVASTYGAAIQGHVLIEPERAVVLEVHVVSDNPYYALRRELAGIESARR